MTGSNPVVVPEKRHTKPQKKMNGCEARHTSRKEEDLVGVAPLSLSPTMSDQSGNNGNLEPPSKRQKCVDGGKTEAAKIIAFGPMYDEATARKMLQEAVLQEADSDEEDGNGAVVGFDPNDAALDNGYYVLNDDLRGAKITPMIYNAL